MIDAVLKTLESPPMGATIDPAAIVPNGAIQENTFDFSDLIKAELEPSTKPDTLGEAEGAAFAVSIQVSAGEPPEVDDGKSLPTKTATRGAPGTHLPLHLTTLQPVQLPDAMPPELTRPDARQAALANPALIPQINVANASGVLPGEAQRSANALRSLPEPELIAMPSAQFATTVTTERDGASQPALTPSGKVQPALLPTPELLKAHIPTGDSPEQTALPAGDEEQSRAQQPAPSPKAVEQPAQSVKERSTAVLSAVRSELASQKLMIASDVAGEQSGPDARPVNTAPVATLTNGQPLAAPLAGQSGSLPQPSGNPAPESQQYQQLESLIDSLTEARQTGRSARGDMVLKHAEFGSVAMRIEQLDHDLTAKLSSRDPAFTAAAQAALNDRAGVAASSETATNHQRGQDHSSLASQSRDFSMSQGHGRGEQDQGKYASQAQTSVSHSQPIEPGMDAKWQPEERGHFA